MMATATPSDLVGEHLVAAIEAVDPPQAPYWAQVLVAGWERGLTPVQAMARQGGIELAERAAWSHLGFAWVDAIDPGDVDAEAFERFPLALARRRHLVPLRSAEGTRVAVADPGDIAVLDDIRSRFGYGVEVVAAETSVIDSILTSAEDRLEVQRIADAAVSIAEEHGVERVEEDTSSDSSMASLVNSIVERAVANRASDIHLEPVADGLVVRYRIDGVLKTVATHSRTLAQGAINRIKVLSHMDIGEQRKPQDGRFSVSLGSRSVDLRGVVLPSVWGESATLRILDVSSMKIDLDHLGFDPAMLERLGQLLSRSNGAVLVTGPTGSGKSTTLYAALRRIAGPEQKVLAVEDPVEYRIPGVSQHQVEPARGFSFATALRSFLRADADIIFVGEIRDAETASMAMDAAFTGHLVLSSFHARSAVSTPIRLVEMGIAPYMVSSGLAGVLGQRLVRRLCPHCRVPDERPRDGIDWGALPVPAQIWRSAPSGCAHCQGTGYYGRLAVGELMVVDDAIVNAIAARAPLGELTAIAESAGMFTLFADGLRRVAAGATTLDEVHRVIRKETD